MMKRVRVLKEMNVEIFGRVLATLNRETHFVFIGNLFYSERIIHTHFDLKGSSYGRTGDKPGEADETTTLKDLDLNFIFQL